VGTPHVKNNASLTGNGGGSSSGGDRRGNRGRDALVRTKDGEQKEQTEADKTGPRSGSYDFRISRRGGH